MSGKTHHWSYRQPSLIVPAESGPIPEGMFRQRCTDGEVTPTTEIMSPTRTKGRWVEAGNYPSLVRLMDEGETARADAKQQRRQDVKQAAKQTGGNILTGLGNTYTRSVRAVETKLEDFNEAPAEHKQSVIAGCMVIGIAVFGCIFIVPFYIGGSSSSPAPLRQTTMPAFDREQYLPAEELRGGSATVIMPVPIRWNTGERWNCRVLYYDVDNRIGGGYEEIKQAVDDGLARRVPFESNVRVIQVEPGFKYWATMFKIEVLDGDAQGAIGWVDFRSVNPGSVHKSPR